MSVPLIEKPSQVMSRRKLTKEEQEILNNRNRKKKTEIDQ